MSHWGTATLASGLLPQLRLELQGQNKRRLFEMKQMLRGLWRDEAGQNLTEYALLLVLIALAAVASMSTLASTIKNVFSNAATNLSSAT